MFKNESIYPFCKFEENPPIFMKLSWKSFCILLIFQSVFYFLDLFFSNSFCCMLRLCCKTWSWLYLSSYILRCCLGLIRVMVLSFCGAAVLSVCCGKWVYMQSVGGERREYRRLFLWLVRYGTGANILYSAVGISLWLLWTVGSYLCLSSVQHFSLFPLSSITCDRPGTADAWITESGSVGFVVRIAWKCI